MGRSLRVQLSAIFLGFLLLVGGSGAATYLAIQAQADDATLINLAGRQRMLTEKMTLLALTQLHSPDLANIAQSFEQTQAALRNGGLAFDSAGQEEILPPAPDPALRAQLDEVARTWSTFRTQLEHLKTHSLTEPGRLKIEQTLQTGAASLLVQLEAVVTGFKVRAEAKLFWLQVIQAIFFGTAFLLLGWGYWLIRRRILSPLAALQLATQRIGQGYLRESIPTMKADELGNLGQAFEAMRVEVAAAHAQLEARVAQRTRELDTAFEFSQEIVADLQLDHLLPSVTERARILTGGQAAALCLLEPAGQFLCLAASSGNVTGRAGLKQAVEVEPVNQIIGEGKTVSAEAGCFNCRLWQVYGSGHCLATPLCVGTQRLGALCVIRPGRSGFDAAETRAFTLLANSAAIAITNAHLVESRRHQAEQAAALAEREGLAAELHDHLAQTLGFLNLKTDQLEELLAGGYIAAARVELEALKPTISGAYGQLRATLVSLCQPATDPAVTSGHLLVEELTTCVADFRAATHLPADLIIADPAALAVPPALQKQILHIVREALTNIRRHAQAHQAWVRVEQVEGEARFTIEDDGHGFDPASGQGENHLGLTLMRARAERSGGRLVIDSAPGAGTKVIVCFPRKELDA
ncbi:MAG: type IV pili methyl-accepting chemotaxis transducer N-terminal domain-containing protein [Anaerolineae bacterium]|nr:type IV pili methyl-accepting chemotaxis transducer N-terminal domain-containing protein [Anaerolineae bacterium]